MLAVKVSVLITTYNREKYITEAIESILTSTYKNLEVVVLDDCSSDNTVSIVSEYMNTDQRVRVVKNDVNLGQFANRNKAIELAKGELIKFLDSDDYLYPHGLELMVHAMERCPEAGIGVPATWFNDKLPFCKTSHDAFLAHYSGGNFLSHGPTAVIYRRDVLKKNHLIFEDKYGILADGLFNLKLACLAPVAFFQSGLYYWRVHNEQVTEGQKKTLQMILERNAIMKAALNYQYCPLTTDEKKLIIWNFNKINLRHLLKFFFSGRIRDAIKIASCLGA